ncbi:MAG: hypothetical protein M1812_000057 [Candelaria pacifica]|nr:MAG: hypothetical protein M1812_000057 [Candelaria pacifica]
MPLDTEILIIGAGMSGLGLAVQLVRKYGTRNFELYEKTDAIGGTWKANSYPGCGFIRMKVPSHLYSYSFALNPNWSQKYSMQPEIQAYFDSVADQYAITPHVSFSSVVQTAEWDTATGTWLVTIQNQKTKDTIRRRCKVLVSAVGALSVPKKCDTPGRETFKGKMFHTAQWDHSFNYKDKEVVVLGNGCSATQFVPVISGGSGKVKKVTQFSRHAHWLSERQNPEYSPAFQWMLRWIPGAMRAVRAKHYSDMESDFAGFKLDSGKRIREGLAQDNIDYLKRTAPKKYHEALVPKTEVGCNRKVLDADYLACLNRDNVELVYDDPVEAIVEHGVRTKSGREVYADAIVLAIGFATHQVLFPMEIRGENGISLNDHWDQTSEGAAQAYYGTCISGFPNFFVMMGPNTTTGWLSVIFTSECQINFTLRMIDPILKSLHPRSSFLSLLGISAPSRQPDTVVVKREAEQADNEWIQQKVASLVFSTGCTSWYSDEKTGKNIMMYPDWQWRYWLRSIFIPKNDFEYKTSPEARMITENEAVDKVGRVSPTSIVVAGVLAAVVGGMLVVDRGAVKKADFGQWVSNAVGLVKGY